MIKNDKIPNDNQKTDGQGISGLPNPWKTIVYLINTFGLAVFLVVWYVVKIQPNNAARYENLGNQVSEMSVNISNLSLKVDELNQLIKNKKTLLTKDQANNIKKLYIETVTSKLNHVFLSKLKTIKSSSTRKENIKYLIDEMQKIMSNNAEYIDGLVELGDIEIKSEIAKRIYEKEGVCNRIAIEAIDKWKDLSPHDVSNKLNWAFKNAFSLTLKPDSS